MKLTAIVLTKNEESLIEKCLSSLSFCDEIVIIDDYSTDKTVAFAKNFGCRVYKRHLREDFSQQRNFGTKKARYPWILWIDADERVPDELRAEIEKAIGSTRFSGYLILRHDIFRSKELKFGGWTDYHVRLVLKDASHWVRAVHEHCLVDGNIGKLASPLMHYSHDSISAFIKSIEHYSNLHALANSAEGKYSSIIKIVLWPIAKFFVQFIAKRGYRDGMEGFIYAFMMSYHSFLAWSILWFYQQKK